MALRSVGRSAVLRIYLWSTAREYSGFNSILLLQLPDRHHGVVTAFDSVGFLSCVLRLDCSCRLRKYAFSGVRYIKQPDSLQFAVLSIYRVFFHPLAKYPGPLSYKLSGWPLLWQAYTGDRHIWHLKDHEKYGMRTRLLIVMGAVR